MRCTTRLLHMKICIKFLNSNSNPNCQLNSSQISSIQTSWCFQFEVELYLDLILIFNSSQILSIQATRTNMPLKALEAEHPIIDSNFQMNAKSSSLPGQYLASQLCYIHIYILSLCYIHFYHRQHEHLRFYGILLKIIREN